MTRALLLLLAVLAAWVNVLDGVFLFDDRVDILENPAAQAATFMERLPHTVRPLLKASYALQDWLHGPWPAGFHAGNLLLHLGAVLLVLALLRRAARLAGRPDGDTLALLAALLWALHPALTESVAYVSGRSALLSGGLLLAALLLATGRPRPWLLAGAGLLALLAPLARETALVLPAALLLWQVTLGRGEARRLALARALPVWGGAALAAALLFALPRQADLVAHSLQTRPPLDALRGNLPALTAILDFWARPWRISFDPAQPPAWGWLEAPTLWRAAAVAALAGAAVLLRRRAPLAAFALGWTLLLLLPTNSVIWRNDPVGLKPLYLAALGPSLLLALGLARLDRLRPAWRPGLALGLILCVALAVATVQRNALFADPVALWEEAVAKAPNRGRAWIALGQAYLAEGRLEEARAALRRGEMLEPWNPALRDALELLALQDLLRSEQEAPSKLP